MNSNLSPKCITELVGMLQVIQLRWHGITMLLPRFAVYSTLHQPIFDKFTQHNGKHIGLIKEGRYTIPVLDPFGQDLMCEPEHVVIVSHIKHNAFGLFGYPADEVKDSMCLPCDHQQVEYIVKDFI